MGWFTHFFSRIEYGKYLNSVNEIVIGNKERVDCQTCTSPISENSNPLAYEQIQNLVSIRHLGERGVAFLPHKILTYVG